MPVIWTAGAFGQTDRGRRAPRSEPVAVLQLIAAVRGPMPCRSTTRRRGWRVVFWCDLRGTCVQACEPNICTRCSADDPTRRSTQLREGADREELRARRHHRRGDRRLLHRRGGPDLRRHGPVRLRQVHAAAHAQRPAGADRRTRPLRRRRPDRAQRPASCARSAREKISMVFQHFALFPHRSVLENAAYGLEVQGVPRAERERARRRGAGAGRPRRAGRSPGPTSSPAVCSSASASPAPSPPTPTCC